MRTQRQELHTAIRSLNVESTKLAETAEEFHNRVDRLSKSASAWLRKLPCPPRFRPDEKKVDQK